VQHFFTGAALTKTTTKANIMGHFPKIGLDLQRIVEAVDLLGSGFAHKHKRPPVKGVGVSEEPQRSNAAWMFSMVWRVSAAMPPGTTLPAGRDAGELATLNVFR
jgi:hypothetical protein